MNRTGKPGITTTVLRCIVAAALASATASAWADAPAVTKVMSLTLEAAQKAASAAMQDCRKRGAMVAVAVTDRAGLPLAVLRDPLAGMHTTDTATRKAWTAISFKAPTSTLEKATAPGTESNGIRHLPGVAMIGGGITIDAAGSIVGGIGVSGAPNGGLDDLCAKAGLAAIREDIEFGL